VTSAAMIKVGCCGFSTSMERYFESFAMVELNSTFYRYPREKTVEAWREKSPKHFEFTVKAHQDISHKARMRVEEQYLQAFERMKRICRVLSSEVLLFQTPSSFTAQELSDAEHFFRMIDREDLVISWETRGSTWEDPKTREKLERVLETLGITHVTDPFKIMPAYTGRTAYFRLHGLGKRKYYYQYTDTELRRLKELVTPFEKQGKTVYALFNNMSMFEDGLRFVKYLSDGVFPSITRSTGLESLKEVIEKTCYPTSKSVLVRKLGWRLIEFEKGKQTVLSTILAGLPSRTYKNVEELLRDAGRLSG
jgi:uncharacterized protein YecE (DUF72 family)